MHVEIQGTRPGQLVHVRVQQAPESQGMGKRVTLHARFPYQTPFAHQRAYVTPGRRLSEALTCVAADVAARAV